MQGKLNFTENEEVLRFISEKNVKILNLCHIPEDGRLKTLSFYAADRDKVEEILEFGERVDGSNLFSFIDPDQSDIYIKPQVNKAFINPFSAMPTLNILCEYLDEDGKPLPMAPKNVLAKAEEKLYASTGVTLKALAELEFYIIAKQEGETLFPNNSDKNYHESSPFAMFENLRNEILVTLAEMGISTKYGHSEVGYRISKDNTLFEQHEIEFTPQSLGKTVENVAIAKWVIRNICLKHGVAASFSPKISLEHAGNGMHIHLCALKNNKNILVNDKATLSVEAKKIIGGLLRFSRSLTAFGNPTPVSHIRFIAHKESPMQICWSARNRLALIRIPLWWNFKKEKREKSSCRETIEFRAPDPLANTYLLFAGIATATTYGLRNTKEALHLARELHIEKSNAKNKKFESLPRSCSESADNLKKDRELYEADNVFPKKLIDKTIEKLNAYNDKNLRENLNKKPKDIEKMLKNYLHYG